MVGFVTTRGDIFDYPEKLQKAKTARQYLTPETLRVLGNTSFLAFMVNFGASDGASPDIVFQGVVVRFACFLEFLKQILLEAFCDF